MTNQNPSSKISMLCENDSFEIICINNLGEPICEKGNNDYRIFSNIEKRYGVYIFFDDLNQPLYVGEATVQDLKTRITQNYNKDSGGTFRDNWLEDNDGKTMSQCKNDEEKKNNLKLFLDALKKNKWKIITISTSKKDQSRWIHVLEKALIGFLNPKHNKD